MQFFKKPILSSLVFFDWPGNMTEALQGLAASKNALANDNSSVNNMLENICIDKSLKLISDKTRNKKVSSFDQFPNSLLFEWQT